MIRRPENVHQERCVITYDHAALTASAGVKFFQALAPFRITSARYINPTGLAEDTTNSFQVGVYRLNALVVADDVFTAANATEIFTAVAHGLLTGDGPLQVSNSGGGLPTGLTAATNYWVIKIDADTFYLATSLALAMAGTNLAITGDGTGTQTISDTASTKRVTAVATGIDTDSDVAGTNTLVADTFTTLTLTSTGANLVLAADEVLMFVATENGTATLPAGRLVVEGRYL